MKCDLAATNSDLDERGRREFRCRKCNAVVRSRQTDPAMIHRVCDSSPRGGFPPMFQQVKSAAVAGAKWAAGGFVRRPADEQNRILQDICPPCEHFAGGRCKLCGCRLKHKVALATEACPVGKWGATAGTPSPKYYTHADLMRDTLALAAKLPADISGVVGHVRSGMIPASLLACHLHLPLWSLDAEHGLQQLGHGWRLKDYRPTPGPLVVVDDSTMTGRSQREIKIKMPPDVEYVSAVVYHNPAAHFSPDLFSVSAPEPHFFDWNIFNSCYTQKAGFDFDGVLCDDIDPADDDDGPRYLTAITNASPLNLPRRGIVPLIATARLEKYRPQTLDWLAKHSVQVSNLVMGPWKNNRERAEIGAVAKFKAAAYSATDLEIFIESCPQQSREIAAITGRRVICPPTAEVF